ncbi:HAD family hydrolase [Palleronia caenipelagi]|uniref:HAD family phosphatase n=1 Tax=Palleronia caenipelagi TaxID=2489174 RepID=A0A547Q095_9RHOB|nr:HAD family phosphatase [Palleronia caenipelagi]TRD19830.1 HAD family phosphatase [Palleronia caenipelagi]
MTPELVVFDIGMVLLNWDPDGFYDRAIGPEARQRLFAEVPLSEANESIDNGAPWHETIEALAADHPEWSHEILAWRDHWHLMATPLIPDSVHLLRELRGRGIACWALTNFGRETFDLAQELYPPLAEFDGTIVSGRLKLMKPDPAIYEALEEASGVSGDRILFTDDRAENIAAAADRGWRTHLFTHSAGFAARLQAEGLLPADALRP